MGVVLGAAALVVGDVGVTWAVVVLVVAVVVVRLMGTEPAAVALG